ncbi:MAG: aldo/keto reductase [Planctomycetota bacterium]
MQYRTLGSTGIKVSALGYGAMRLPVKPGGKPSDVDEEKAIACIHRAFDLGVNYIDTAHGYHGGMSEVVVGKAVAGRRDRIIVSTKNPYRKSDAGEWRRTLDKSLDRLKMDYLDLLLIHYVSYDEVVGPMAGPGHSLDAALKARDEGLFRHFSFSSHDKPENIIRLIDTGMFATMTVQYNLLDRANEKAIAHAHEKGMGVIIMGPIGGGRLVEPSEFQKLIPGGGKSTPEIALRFVLSNPAVSTALSGMNAIQQVEENCASASREEPMSAAEMRQVERMLKERQKLAELYCTGCGYCLPCPNEVNIPACFHAMNYHRVYGLTELARREYRAIRPDSKQADKKGKRADQCKECGDCEDKCPQKIPIREQLKEAAERLGK